MQIRRRLPAIAAAGGALALLVYLLLPRPIEVDVASARRGPLEVTIDEEGKTRIRERYVVSAPLAGRMSRVELHPGDNVTSHETILTTIEPVEPSLLNDRDLAEIEARVKSAQAAMDAARATELQATEQLQLADDNFERARKLFESRALSRHDYDAAEHGAAIAKERHRAAAFLVRQSEYELEVAKAAFVRSRPHTSETADHRRLDLKSPIDGQVLRVFVEDAGVVSPGTRLLEVGNPADLEIEVEILSADAVQVNPGAKVWIEHWGGSHVLTGRVRLIEPAGFTKISPLGVEEQRVRVVVDFVEPLEPRTRLGDSFRVEARIVIWSSTDVLKVPAGALFRSGDQWTTFRSLRGRAVQTAVEVGQSNGLETEIRSGLWAGDEVILHPSDWIADGGRVRSRTTPANQPANAIRNPDIAR
jgi:HlyD family secretion protein